MSFLRFIFLPEIGAALRDAGGTLERSGRLLAVLLPRRRPAPGNWRSALTSGRRFGTVLALGVCSLGLGCLTLGIAGLLAPEASAQGIDGGFFAEEDDGTRRLLSFLTSLGGGSSALGDMLFVFNGGLLLLGGALLVYHTVFGTVETGREGRWGFGGWQIIRIVAAVALMAPLPGGMNGAQHMVLGIAGLGGDFANAVWEPFSEDVLGDGEPVIPPPDRESWRAVIARMLVLETCMHAANASARRAGESDYIKKRMEQGDGYFALHYDGDGRGMPKDLCGAYRVQGYGKDRSTGRLAAAHVQAYLRLHDFVEGQARELAERFVAGSPLYGQPLPDPDAVLESRALDEIYAGEVEAAIASAAASHGAAVKQQVIADTERDSWLSAAVFFNTMAQQTGRFQEMLRNTPTVSLPAGTLDRWSQPADAASKGVILWISQSSRYHMAVTGAYVGSGAASHLPSDLPASFPFVGLSDFVFDCINVVSSALILDDGRIMETGNPIADLAAHGHSMIGCGLKLQGALSVAATASNGFEAVPIVGDGLDAFEAVWQVIGPLVTMVLMVMVVAGIVLAYVLPALPFIRFLFGILGWLLNVVESFLAITVFALGHMGRSEPGLATQATRQGWLLLAALLLRPVLMLFGLILGYQIFLAGVGFLNRFWLPFLGDAQGSGGPDLLGTIVLMAIYVMLAYALLNGALKLIDIVPNRVILWIGGYGFGQDSEADSTGGTITGGAGRAEGLRLTKGSVPSRFKAGGRAMTVKQIVQLLTIGLPILLSGAWALWMDRYGRPPELAAGILAGVLVAAFLAYFVADRSEKALALRFGLYNAVFILCAYHLWSEAIAPVLAAASIGEVHGQIMRLTVPTLFLLIAPIPGVCMGGYLALEVMIGGLRLASKDRKTPTL